MALFTMIPATTKRAYLQALADTVYTGTPLLTTLRKKGINYSGGEFIVEPIIAARANGARFTGFDVLTAPDNQEVDAARYNWRQYYASVAISGIQVAQNSGPEKVIDIFGAKMQGASLTLSDLLADDIMAVSGTAAADAVTSIDDIVETSTATEVGGLTGTDLATWVGKARIPAAGAGTPLLLIDVENLYLDVSEGNIHPNLLVGAKDTYARIWSLLIANQRYLGADANAGFENLKFNDSLVVFDSHVIGGTAGSFTGKRLYALNTDFMRLSVHKDWDFVMEEKEPTNQNAYLAYIYWFGNLTCNNRRFQGTLHNFTT